MVNIPKVYQSIFAVRSVKNVPDNEIADILKFYVKIYPDGYLEWSAAFTKLTIIQQIIIYFFVVRALYINGHAESQRVTPVDVTIGIEASGGTVRPYLRRLSRKKGGILNWIEDTHEYQLTDYDKALKLVRS